MEEILGGISNKANKICRNLTRWHLFSGLQFAHGIPRAGRSRPRNGIFGKFRQWVRSRMPALPCSEDTVRKKKSTDYPVIVCHHDKIRLWYSLLCMLTGEGGTYTHALADALVQLIYHNIMPPSSPPPMW